MAERSGRRRRVVVVLVLVIGMAGLGWWISHRTPESGDPGGIVLSELKPAAGALPGAGTSALPLKHEPTMGGAYLIEAEPRWGNGCDGRSGTQGWTPASVQAAFLWSGSPESLASYVAPRLKKRGWQREPTGPSSGHQMIWKKKLTTGSIATVELNEEYPGSPSVWGFVATGRPVGTAESGC